MIGGGIIISTFVTNSLRQKHLWPTTTTIWYIQTGSTLQAAWLYYNQSGFNVGDFQWYILGWSYNFYEGKHIGKSNLMSYKGIALPQHITTVWTQEYLWTSRDEQVSNYIKNFIHLDTTLLQEHSLDPAKLQLPKVNLISHFHLGCINSPWKITDEFCRYNLEQSVRTFYQVDLVHSIKELAVIFQQAPNDEIKNTICQSILSYEMTNNDIHAPFEPLLKRCDERFLQTHLLLHDRKDINKELQTTLSTTLFSWEIFNQYKLVSAMQLIYSHIITNTIDIDFLNSYYVFVSEYIKSPTIDPFTIDLIYKFHNQYLIPGFIELQKVVNVDTVRDLQNMIDKFDSINNGDNLNSIGLRYRVSPEVIKPDDYASTHPPLWGNQVPVFKPSTGSWVDNTIINTLIGSIDTTIQKNIDSTGGFLSWTTNELPQGNQTQEWWIQDNTDQETQEVNSQSSTTTGQNNQWSETQETTTPKNSQQNTSTKEEDLNTYQPQKTVVYSPTINAIDKQKTVISDRFYNNLGLRPTNILLKSTKQFVERTYQWFDFSALLDQDNDRKLYPIYVQLDGVRTVIPNFELYLMDYDRYSQVKFLKNPEQYVRQATQ